MTKLEGIITAMVTPFDESGNIDIEGTHQLINRLIDSGIHGLFILGTNGEFFSLTDVEKVEFAKIVVNEVNGRVPVYAGAGGISTKNVINLVKEYEKINITAVSIITPFLISLSEEEVYNHYKEIILATSASIILYNIPQNTHISITPNIFEQLIKFPRVVGIKDSSGDLNNISEYLRIANKSDVSVLIGSDSKILTALRMGAVGAVSGTSNILTKTNLAIYESFKKGDLESAQRYQEMIEPYRLVNRLGSVPSMLKKAMNKTGNNVGTPRLPVLSITDEEQLNKLEKTLDYYKEIEGF